MADIPEGDIYNAIVDEHGNLGAVAETLGVSRSALKTRVDASPLLTTLMNDYRESIVDTAEQNVFLDVKKGDPQACRFVLGTLGKERGYSTKVETNNAPIEVVVRNVAAEMAAAHSGTGEGASDE